MSAMGIICSPGRTHMMGPSSLSVGLWSLRLENVPQGKVRCDTQAGCYTMILTNIVEIDVHTATGSADTVHAQHAHTHLQKGRSLQHVDELREVISHLLVHGPHQADLPHGPGPVRSLGVRSLHLQQENIKDHDPPKQVPTSFSLTHLRLLNIIR